MTTGKRIEQDDQQPEQQGTGNREAKFYTPPNYLKQKVGHGGFDPVHMRKAQDLLENHKVELPDIAGDILKKLDKAIAAARKEQVADKGVINKISGPVMELKANGAMFHYPLVSDIANILLNFLENIEELNDDGFDIIDVHQKTLDVIIKNRLKGEPGAEGRALASELSQACRRYRKKYSVALDVK